jgi:hypothetical protein
MGAGEGNGLVWLIYSSTPALGVNTGLGSIASCKDAMTRVSRSRQLHLRTALESEMECMIDRSKSGGD